MVITSHGEVLTLAKRVVSAHHMVVLQERVTGKVPSSPSVHPSYVIADGENSKHGNVTTPTGFATHTGGERYGNPERLVSSV